MSLQTALPPATFGMRLIHLKVLWKSAETCARTQNYSSVSGVSATDAVPKTNSGFHPLRPGQSHPWVPEYLYWFVDFERALFLG